MPDACEDVERIVGGGAAGAALALLRARAGARVVLVDHGRGPISGPFETLLPAARTLLRRIGLDDVVAACAEPDTLRHGAIWGAADVVWRTPEPGGLLLRRGAFERALRAAAAAAGANVVDPATAVHDVAAGPRRAATAGVDRIDAATGRAHERSNDALRSPARVAIATGRRDRGRNTALRGDGSSGTDKTANAALRDDGGAASGTGMTANAALRDGGVAASRSGGTAAAPVRTFAFTFVGEPAATDRGTAVVEAVRSGWVWTHAPATGPASAAFVVDADELRAVGRAALLARARAEATGPASRLAHARLRHATDATPRWTPAAAGELRLGDAAATIDPLASQGVEKALAAADHAAAVLATAWAQPAWWERLCDVHARWERDLAAAHGRAAAAWYSREGRFADAPFWRARRVALVAREHEPGSEADRAAVLAARADPALVDAAHGARAAAAVDAPLAIAATLAPATVLVREGATFVERDGFVDARTGDAASHVGYVPIAPLLACFATPRPLHAAVAAAGRDARLFVLPPRAVHAAMLELQRRGWLVAATS